LVHNEGNNNYNFRVIEYQNREGQAVRKFVVSEFWWCDKSNRWYPSRKHHVFLPLAAWSKLISLGNVVQQYASSVADGQGHFGPDDATSQPTASQQSTGRRRGRPPKCANERRDADIDKSVSTFYPEPAASEEVDASAKKRREFGASAQTPTLAANGTHAAENRASNSADDERTAPAFAE
jgi:hypothetical protein